MAANAILPSAGAGQNNSNPIFDNFERRFLQAFEGGDTSYTISFSGFFKDGRMDSQQLSSLKEHVEFQLGCPVNMNVDASRNTLTTRAMGDIKQPVIVDAASPDGTMSFQESDEVGDATLDKPTKKAKVPRPPNAFIIYRKEWHARVVAENPGLHNNTISIIIGRKWKKENQEVKDHYQHKAAEAKHQHQLANPNYHYQPRKPSEKKKRMTKTKLAKLAAKNAAALNYPAEIQDQANKFVTMAEQMELPVFNPGPQFDTTSKPGYMSFNAISDPNNLITKEFHAQNAAIVANPAALASALNGSAAFAPSSDGDDVADLESYPVNLPNVDTGLYGADAFDLDNEVGTPTIDYGAVQAPFESFPQFDNFFVDDSEVFRQGDLDELFDFDSFSYNNSSH